MSEPGTPSRALHVVPGGDTPQQGTATTEEDERLLSSVVASRWTSTLVEPLWSTSARAEADLALAQYIDANQTWGVYWFAGFLHEIAITLPPEDPWRVLSGRLSFSDVSTVRSSVPDVVYTPLGSSPAPASTGATLPDGKSFGSVEDAYDLILPGAGGAAQDLELGAISEPLSGPSAAIVAFASGDIEFVASTLSRVFHQLWAAGASGAFDTGSPGTHFIEFVAPALRRLIHRRRVYVGASDEYVHTLGFAWIARAERLMMGTTRRASSEVGLSRGAAIAPGEYSFRTEF